MSKYQKTIGIDFDGVIHAYKKPKAIAYIDDRGIRFTNWTDILNIMGNKHEIYIWKEHKILGWQYEMFWRGESFFSALINFIKAKKETGCVKWEWR